MRIRPRWRSALSSWLLYLTMAFFAFLMAFPFYWMIITTFKTTEAIFTSRIYLLPLPFSLEQYLKVIGAPYFPLVRIFFNTVFVSLGATFVCVLVSILAAYPLARRDVPGGRFLYYFILATMMIPGQVVFIGLFKVVRTLNLLNTYPGLILPMSLSPITFLILHSYISELPVELEEAAVIDGATIRQVLFQVIFPLSMPAVASAGILHFLSTWQAFLLPYMLTLRKEMYTLPVAGLWFENELSSMMPERLALAAVMSVPVIIVFIVTQRHVFRGILGGALKG